MKENRPKEKKIQEVKSLPNGENKVGKAKHKMKKNKKIPNISNQPNSTEDFSSNWKKFLEEEKKKPVPKKDENKNSSKKTDGAGKRRSWKKHKEIVDEKPVPNPIWFDDVDPLLLEQECGIKSENSKKENGGEIKNVPISSTKLNDETVLNDPSKYTKHVALDCEMVGIGFEGKEHALARVSLVNSNCECIYDKFVKPAEKVVDYRTAVSGVRPSDLVNAPGYKQVQKEVADILKDRILVGHALQNDLKVLMLGHSRKQIRDTAKYKPFHKLLRTNRPALKKLVAVILKESIQSGEHSSIIDARVTMKIYKLYRKDWEKSLHTRKAEESKEVFMGTNDSTKKKKNKWTKIRQQKKSKD